MTIEYGVRPEGMSDADWTIECQCRFVAREARKLKTPGERLALLAHWKKKLPGLSEARVREIYKLLPGSTPQRPRNRR